MWAVAGLAAFALAGSAFMVWFLMGLLRDGQPFVCYLIVPTPRGQEMRLFEAIDANDVDDDWPSRECRGLYRLELLENLENESHAKATAGLIALDVHSAPASLGWSSIRNQARAFREPSH